MKYIPKGMTRLEYEQRYVLRHKVNTVALAYLIMLIIQLLWEYYFIKILKLFGIPVSVLSNMVSNTATMLVLNVALTAIMFTVPFIAVLSRESIKVSKLISFAKPKREYFIPLVFMGIGGCMLANIIGNYVTKIFSSLGIENEDVFTSLPQGVFGVLLSYVAVCVAPALLEEFAWRGVTMNVLRRGGDGYALFVSAMFFGLMHLNMTQIPFAFVVGLVLGFAYIKSGSFWTGAVIHFINNALSVTLEYATDGMDVLLNNLIQTAVMIVAIILGLAGLMMYINRGGDFRLQNRMCELKTSKKAKLTLFSPLVIAVILLSFAVVVLT